MLLLFLLISCRKDGIDEFEILKEKIQGSWALEAKLDNDMNSMNTWNETWTFQEDGIFHLYSEVAIPYDSYTPWYLDSLSPNTLYFNYWGLPREFQILELRDSTCRLRHGYSTSNSFTSYHLKRL